MSDIGRLAAAAAVDPASGRGACVVYEVSGPAMLTMKDMAGSLSKVLGRVVTHVPVPAAGLEGMPPALKELLIFMEKAGEKAIPVSDAVKRVAGKATTFDEWAEVNKGAF